LRVVCFFFSSRRRHTSFSRDWSSDVCSSDLYAVGGQELGYLPGTEAEKMSPWAQAVFDTLGAVVHENVVEEVVARGLLEVLPLKIGRASCRERAEIAEVAELRHDESHGAVSS